jgi:endonuclease/exonuclease/phosphatase family metal-dependent hydrolase
MKHFLVVFLLLPQLLATHFAYIQDRAQSHPRSRISTGDDDLLEAGKGTKLREPIHDPTELKIISFNIRWRSGNELKKLIRAFQEDREIRLPAIIALQEVDRQKERSGKTNTARLLAEELGLHYAWAAPPTAKPDDEEETGVAILSAYPLSDLQRIVLPHEGPNRRRRVALGASLKISDQVWRVYSVHSETRISMDKKLAQMNAVLQDLAKYPSTMPAIVMGDLNTWEADAERKTFKLFSNAGLKTPFGPQATFSRKILFVPIEMKLDWVWLRGLEPVSYGIDKSVDISDHWPLWTNIKVPVAKK